MGVYYRLGAFPFYGFGIWVPAFLLLGIQRALLHSVQQGMYVYVHVLLFCFFYQREAQCAGRWRGQLTSFAFALAPTASSATAAAACWGSNTKRCAKRIVAHDVKRTPHVYTLSHTEPSA